MALQKKKREQKVKETEKIHHQDLQLKAKKLEITEKTKCVKGKESKVATSGNKGTVNLCHFLENEINTTL